MMASYSVALLPRHMLPMNMHKPMGACNFLSLLALLGGFIVRLTLRLSLLLYRDQDWVVREAHDETLVHGADVP